MIRRFLALLAIALVAAPVAGAGTGKTWTISGMEQFSKGKLEGLSLLATGEMELAPEVERLPGLQANFVWDVVPGPEGVLYVGTGAPASVYALQEGKLTLLHKTSEKHVLSVLPLPDGSVLAATAPRGIIYRINGEGEVTIFAELEEPYVWDMALSAAGEVLCATGPRGRLKKIAADRSVSELFKSDEQHLMCIAVGDEDRIFLGSAPKGLVYKVEQDGSGEIVYDPDESEVHCVVLGPQGYIFVGTAESTPSAGGSAPPPGPGPGPQPANDAAASLKGKPAAHNSVYRIKVGEGAVRMAHLANTFVLSLLVKEDGQLMVGTGVEGRLMEVDSRGTTNILTQFEAAHISAIARDAQGTIYLGTSNGGGLWRIKEGARNSGTFTSEVFDCGYISHWGRAWWRGSVPSKTRVRLSLRTGNSRTPDRYWSDWSKPVADAAGGALAVPPGRFAQVQAELLTDNPKTTPLLTEVNISYRQVNRRPQIQKLEVNKAQKPAQGPGGPRQDPKMIGKRKITWQATDPNQDELIFDLYYRGIDEKEWKELKTDIRKTTQYVWDTNRVPDGHYVLRLVASDRLCCPPSDALSAEKVSKPCLIDNRRPEVLDLKANRKDDGTYVITGTAVDGYSTIREIQVSHNSGDWQPVFPSDGIFDATREAFTFRTEALPQGEHVFVFVACDERFNVGSEKIVIVVE